MRSRALTKWQCLIPEQRDMLTEAIRSVCGVNTSFEEFAETARSFMESIAGLETLTEREASSLVNELWRNYMAKKPSKAKQAEKPVKKETKKDAVVKAAEAPAPKASDSSPKEDVVDFEKSDVKKAIDAGLAVLKEGKSKADAAWAIYNRLKDADKDLIVLAFIKGANLTEKGALTYWYNCKRKAAKEVPAK